MLAKRLTGIWIVALKLIQIFNRSLTLVIADVTESKIPSAAEKPCARVSDLVPMGVEFDKRILDEVLSRFTLADKAVGIAQQWGFLRLEDL